MAKESRKKRRLNASKYNAARTRAINYIRQLNELGYMVDNYDALIGESKSEATTKDVNSARARFSRVNIRRLASRRITDWSKNTTINGISMVRSGIEDYGQGDINVETDLYANSTSSQVIDYINRLKKNTEEKHGLTSDVMDSYVNILKKSLGKGELDPLTPGESNEYVEIPADYPNYPSDREEENLRWLWDNAKLKKVDPRNKDVMKQVFTFDEHPYTSEDLYEQYQKHRTLNNDKWDKRAKGKKLDPNILNKIEYLMNSSQAWNVARKESYYEGGTGGAIDEEWMSLGEELYRAVKLGSDIAEDIIRDIENENTTLSQIRAKIDKYIELRDAFK